MYTVNMPKNLIYVIGIAQLFIAACHWLGYELLLLFFPALYPYHILLAVIMLLLSFAFLLFTLLTHNYQSFLLNWGNVLAGIWIVWGLYFLMASALTLVLCALGLLALTTAGHLSIIVSLTLVVYGAVNARVIRIKHLTVNLPNLPDFWKGKTAVMVSDLHLGQILKNGFAKKIIKITNSLNPEIVFIPGDFYDGARSDFQGLANEFKKIKAPLGIYFCSGNHEMFAGYGICEQAIRNAGIKILEDQKVEIEGLQVLGLAYKQETDETVKTRLLKTGLANNKPSILLKHVPSHLSVAEQSGVSLQLSGHTHLGQIWPGRYVTRKIFKGYDYGLKALGDLQVLTSSGVGTWGPALRIFTESEIIKITFQSLG